MQDLSDSSTTYEKPTFGEAGNGLKASIDFEAWAGPRLNFDISIYDAAGPAFQVGVHVGVQANLVFDTTTTPTTKSAAIEVFVGLNARGSVQLKVPIIDKVILSKELKTIADRWPIGSWEWNPNEGVNKSGTTTPPDGIDIPDTNFRACVNQHLGQPDDASITAAQAASLGDLKCLSRGIASLAGLESFPELWYVDLRNNHITDLSALAEANLPALEWLYLGNNQITDLAALAGANLPALKEVGLQDNHITDLSGLAGANLPALDGFHLGNNQITDLVGLAEANLPALGMLDLSSNGITDLSPLAAANLLALGRLYLSDNHITDLSPLAAASLPTLGTLDLSDNQITDLPLLAAANLPNLGMLYLSNNQITDLSPLAGANLPSLGMLDLSNNQIADLPPLAGVPTVRWLYLSNNQITDLSGLAGANLPALEWVYLGNNQITDLSPLAALDYESWVYEQSVSFNGTGLSGRLPLITARDGGSVPLVLSDDGGLDLTITGTTVTASGPGTAVFTWGNGDQSFSGTVALTFG
ncbi:MAG: leucine-rich repeat domain-containing protein [Bifidobacteriaceae bacterium]|nr:leucine-rich repeat domain-containing protein [Bifidobacteriaceae bacterium]